MPTFVFNIGTTGVLKAFENLATTGLAICLAYLALERFRYFEKLARRTSEAHDHLIKQAFAESGLAKLKSARMLWRFMILTNHPKGKEGAVYAAVVADENPKKDKCEQVLEKVFRREKDIWVARIGIGVNVLILLAAAWLETYPEYQFLAPRALWFTIPLTIVLLTTMIWPAYYAVIGNAAAKEGERLAADVIDEFKGHSDLRKEPLKVQPDVEAHVPGAPAAAAAPAGEPAAGDGMGDIIRPGQPPRPDGA